MLLSSVMYLANVGLVARGELPEGRCCPASPRTLVERSASPREALLSKPVARAVSWEAGAPYG